VIEGRAEKARSREEIDYAQRTPGEPAFAADALSDGLVSVVMKMNTGQVLRMTLAVAKFEVLFRDRRKFVSRTSTPPTLPIDPCRGLPWAGKARSPSSTSRPIPCNLGHGVP
jgi:hypothetical protein